MCELVDDFGWVFDGVVGGKEVEVGVDGDDVYFFGIDYGIGIGVVFVKLWK